MNKHVIAEICLGGAILICVCWIGWDQYHKALANDVAQQTAEIKRQAQQQVDDVLSARDKQYKQDIETLQGKYEALKKMTPQQIVQKAPEYIAVPKPIVIAGPETQGVTIGSAIVPPEDIQPIATAILDGAKCKVDFAKCSADLGDWQRKYDLKAQESDEWEKAAKGGSWMKRLGKNVLKVGAGVAVGYMLHR